MIIMEVFLRYLSRDIRGWYVGRINVTLSSIENASINFVLI
jgi:hypothetical protein